jgi:hypothetical protein
MAYFTLSAASGHIRAVSMYRRAVNVTFRSCAVLSFLTRAQPLVAAAPPVAVHHKAFSALASTSGTPDVVLVKVGTGKYSPLEDISVINKNRSGILKALKADEIFANDLKDVSLNHVAVLVLPSVAGDVPTPAEEKAATELVGNQLLHASRGCGNLFLRVTLSNDEPEGKSCNSAAHSAITSKSTVHDSCEHVRCIVPTRVVQPRMPLCAFIGPACRQLAARRCPPHSTGGVDVSTTASARNGTGCCRIKGSVYRISCSSGLGHVSQHY